MLYGDKISPSILISVIRFILPHQNNVIRKHLLIFWELFPKVSQDNKLLPEMILVCDAYRKDLQHPNEFIRGATLRFLCKLKHVELLEPLMLSIRQCLDNRHIYVRKNAVLAICTIYRNFPQLIPDAPEFISNYLQKESDISCKRNAFIMLMQIDQDKALVFVKNSIESIGNFGETLQLIIIELIYNSCISNVNERKNFVKCIFSLVSSSSNCVSFEAANVLISLTNSSTAIKAIVNCYINIIIKETDNNIRIIVLGKLLALKSNSVQFKILQESVLDIINILASATDLDVRKITLSLVRILINQNNYKEVINVLKKEIEKIYCSSLNDSTVSVKRCLIEGKSVVENTSQKESNAYFIHLIKTLTHCCLQFPDCALHVLSTLIEMIDYYNEEVTTSILEFVRYCINENRSSINSIIKLIIHNIPKIYNARVIRDSYWIICEFATELESLQLIVDLIYSGFGQVINSSIITNSASNDTDKTSSTDEKPTLSTKTRVNADGSYVTESSFQTSVKSVDNNKSTLEILLISRSDYFNIVSILATTEKMLIRYALNKRQTHKNHINSNSTDFAINNLIAKILLLSAVTKQIMSTDSKNQNDVNDYLTQLCDIMVSLGTVFNESDDTSKHVANKFQAQFDQDVHQKALNYVISETIVHEKCANNQNNFLSGCCVDEPINFGIFSNSNDIPNENVLLKSLKQATNSSNKVDIQATKLNKVTALTGLSDPVYAEAYITVGSFSVQLDVLIVNQTTDTLQNLTLELSTLGELKLVEKPAFLVLAPGDFANIKATIRVSSTENGVIFGNIIYKVAGSSVDHHCVVLECINIDILEYLSPSICNDHDFRRMWSDFEWENKVPIYINHTNKCWSSLVIDFRNALHMECLTLQKKLKSSIDSYDESDFFTVNLYCKSSFGEDALANMSLEFRSNDPESVSTKGTINGHLRIRSKTQGLALALGDKVNEFVRNFQRANISTE